MSDEAIVCQVSIDIRIADKSDCRRIAELYRISSDGVSEYVWTKSAAPGEEILDVGRRRYERKDTPFSYRNCKMVEHDGRVIGMFVAFPLVVDPDYRETDPVLVPYSVLEEDRSYYICGMAVEPEWRGRGIGARLLAEGEADCRKHGLDKLSLVVFEQNVGAKRLYERAGFREVRRAPVVPHPLIHYGGDAVLMVRVV